MYPPPLNPPTPGKTLKGGGHLLIRPPCHQTPVENWHVSTQSSAFIHAVMNLAWLSFFVDFLLLIILPVYWCLLIQQKILKNLES